MHHFFAESSSDGKCQRRQIIMNSDQIAAIRPALIEAIAGPPGTCATFEVEGGSELPRRPPRRASGSGRMGRTSFRLVPRLQRGSGIKMSKNQTETGGVHTGPGGPRRHSLKVNPGKSKWFHSDSEVSGHEFSIRALRGCSTTVSNDRSDDHERQRMHACGP